jgi:hypothetical protein
MISLPCLSSCRFALIAPDNAAIAFRFTNAAHPAITTVPSLSFSGQLAPRFEHLKRASSGRPGVLVLTRSFLHNLLTFAIVFQFPFFHSRTTLLFLLPLRRRKALRRPGMDRSNLFLERSVDQPVPRKRHLLLELCRHDDRFEHLTAAAWQAQIYQYICDGACWWWITHLTNPGCRRVRLPVWSSAPRPASRR